MPAVFSIYSEPLQNDGQITIALAPPTTISGFGIQCDLLQNFGGTPIVSKYLASGFNGVSGITIVDGTNGIFSINFPASDLTASGFQAGNYPFNVYFQSGNPSNLQLAYGFRIAT